MSTTTIIRCDHCKNRAGRASHTHLVIHREILGQVIRLDLCGDCTQTLILDPLALGDKNDIHPHTNGRPMRKKA